MDLDKLGKLKIQKIINDGKSITYDRFEYLFKKYPNKSKCLIVNYLAEKGIDLIEQETEIKKVALTSMTPYLKISLSKNQKK